MNLLTITDKFIKDTDHMGNEQFALHVRRLCKEKASTNPESLYQKFMDIYNEFHQKKIGTGAKIGAKEGAAAKSILAYISKESKDKSEAGILLSWQYILDNWVKLEPFYRNRLQLNDINSNLTNILNQLRNGKQPAKTITESATSISEWDGN